MTQTSEKNTAGSFAVDVLSGLSRSPKKLSSRYFYDHKGDLLFQQIMRMPAYYLTDCETEIFHTFKADLRSAFGEEPFELIELGAGDGMKTKILIAHFLDEGACFSFRPIDISGHVLQQLGNDLRRRWPQLDVRPLEGDYFEMLASLAPESAVRKVVLFLGSNIGNYTREEAARFLRQLQGRLDPGDLLLVGFDLKKDPAVVLHAYNDPEGITAAFNLNLLARINRELDGDFALDQFGHWETYNPATGEAKSYLVSKKRQDIRIGALRQSFSFDAWEAIEVELSLKYDQADIETLAASTGFEVEKHFFDHRRYFVDSLWRCV